MEVFPNDYNHVWPSIKWDILGICLEAEFKDAVAPGFYLLDLFPVYMQGHFPCGWDGNKLETTWDGVLGDYRLFVW
jgi:hypothetical protein